jgi:hypothetical protein
MEINQQLEQQINIKFLVKVGKSGPEIMSDVAAGSWGRCFKKEHCFQVGAALSRRPKRSHRQQKVRVPFQVAQR